MRQVLQVDEIYQYTHSINMHVRNNFKIIDFNQDYPSDDLAQENDDYLYYYCSAIEELCKAFQNSFMSRYYSLSSLVSNHNINKKFNIPMFDNIAIMDDPIFNEIFSFSMLSFNLPKLLKQINKIIGKEKMYL